MTESVKGKSVAETKSVFDKVHTMLTGVDGTPANPDELGKLAVLSGVCEFPTRVKCATLAWHTLLAALAGEESVSTE